MVIAIILFSTLILSIVIGILTIPRIVSLAHELHLYDLPDSRKIHKLPIPRLGGVSFLPAVIVAIATVIVTFGRICGSSPIMDKVTGASNLIAYLAGAFMLFLLGIYDDVHGVSYKYKFLVQVASATLLCVSGLWIANLDHIFFIDSIPFWIGMPLTIVFVVYVTNAMNLIDGIDGLASGLSIISLFVATLLCVMSGDILWAMIATSYLGVLLTFFCYNVFGHKNKVFMGDAGSLTLGFTLSFLILHFWQLSPVWNPYLHNLGIVILSTLVIPLFDVVRVMMSRLRDGRNPFLPDKNHIHHKLVRAGLSGRMTMITLLLISVLIIVANYLVASQLSQTLIIVLDIAVFIVMHMTINVFITRKERKTGISHSRWF